MGKARKDDLSGIRGCGACRRVKILHKPAEESLKFRSLQPKYKCPLSTVAQPRLHFDRSERRDLPWPGRTHHHDRSVPALKAEEDADWVRLIYSRVDTILTGALGTREPILVRHISSSSGTSSSSSATDSNSSRALTMFILYLTALLFGSSSNRGKLSPIATRSDKVASPSFSK